MNLFRRKLEYERELLFFETKASTPSDIYNKAEEIAIKKMIIQNLIDGEKEIQEEVKEVLMEMDSVSANLYRYLKDYRLLEMDMVKFVPYIVP